MERECVCVLYNDLETPFIPSNKFHPNPSHRTTLLPSINNSEAPMGINTDDDDLKETAAVAVAVASEQNTSEGGWRAAIFIICNLDELPVYRFVLN